MAFQQTFDSSTFNLSGMMDKSAEMAAKSREIGAELVNLSVRNFESAARAGRSMTDVRDPGDALRIQMDYMKEVMGAFSEHSSRIAEIVMTTARQTGAEAKSAAEKSMAAAGEAARASADQVQHGAARGMEAARKPDF